MNPRKPQDVETKELAEPPVVAGRHSFTSLTAKISGIVLRKEIGIGWLGAFGGAFLLLMMLLYAIARLFIFGIGIWGVNIPVAWGFAITNFVWWIGIGHAGTLISAILLLLHQNWRTSINRFAEAMTLFAVACAGLFPLLHLGRPWYFYWLLPYPNTMELWPQFRSPLVWDVFAVFTYATVSLVFWYIGMIPDLATLRDRAQSKWAWLTFGVLSLGWRGASQHWHRYEKVYLLLAGLATPLVVSVHTVVSFDFAVAILPGWHSTIFPPYFVAGAVYSGFAMVITLAVPIRFVFALEDYITIRHIENMAKVMLATGLMVTFSYISENFYAWYSGNIYEMYIETNRATGAYAPMYWTLIACVIVAPQFLWSQRIRRSPVVLLLLAIVINVGMWIERYIIVVTSLHHDFMPSMWGQYAGTQWDWMTLIGSFGLFLSLMYLFIRFLPVISMSEMRRLLTEVNAKRSEQ